MTTVRPHLMADDRVEMSELELQDAGPMEGHEDDDQLPPPAYHEVTLRDGSRFQDSSSTTDPRELEFLDQATNFQRFLDIEDLRSFLTALLKIDYGLATASDRNYSRHGPMAKRLNVHFMLFEQTLGGDNDRAAELFLTQMPSPLMETLGLDHRFLCLWLADYRSIVSQSEDGLYGSFFDGALMGAGAMKLWMDREEVIDAIASADASAPQLQAALHAALLKRQQEWFEDLEHPTDYTLTPLGKTVNGKRLEMLAQERGGVMEKALESASGEAGLGPFKLRQDGAGNTGCVDTNRGCVIM